MTQRWIRKQVEETVVQALAEACNLPVFVAQILVARGIDTPEKVLNFLNPEISRDRNDPHCIPGLSQVAQELSKAIEDNKRILVFGDFDADGITSTALMIKGLAALGCEAIPFIPNRSTEGYGLTDAALQRVFALNPEVIVTVDCGISGAKEVQEILARGIQVMITDHHEPSDTVPQGVPVADPKLDPNCPSKGLAGVGVALKLITLLGEHFNRPDVAPELIDLAAIGTVADLMPLVGENRALVAAGLKKIIEQPRPGISASLALANQSLEDLTATGLSFSLIPRINASGRMGDPMVALDLLCCDDPVQAHEFASRLEQVNQDRRNAELELGDLVLEVAQEQVQEGQRIIILAGEGWHEGVKGIVASRLVNRFGVPVILFSIENGEARGSGRSVGDVNLFDAIDQCADLTLRYGGHHSAVGVTVAVDKLDEFRSRMEALMEELPASCFDGTQEFDAVCNPGDLSLPNVETLALLEPFGQDNPTPLLLSSCVFLEGAKAVGSDGSHLSFSITDGFSKIRCIYFRCPDVEYFSTYEGPVDVLFSVKIDEWRGRRQVKLFVEDLRTYTFSQTEVFAQELSDEHYQLIEDAEQEAEADFTQSLVSSFLGSSAVLNRVQARSLEHLANGRSSLVIMPTGRGKSLIFHIHAVRLALLEQKASVFIYPLRALINDQAQSLRASFGDLGLNVAVLNGETSPEERDAGFEGLKKGDVSVVLTTPEFLTIHLEDFVATQRIGFFVIDEAHHVGQARENYRAAYGQLSCIRQRFPEATVLALSATVNDDIAQGIMEVLGLEDTVRIPESDRVDRSQRSNLLLDDARRGCKDRDCYLSTIVAQGEKTLIYASSRGSSVELVRTLRKALPQQAERICFYNAGLSRDMRVRIENMFRSGEITTLVATSAFGEGVNIPDIRHVVLYGLPLNDVELNQMAGRGGRDGDPATVHLLFNMDDIQLSRQIVAAEAPSRDLLVCLYKELKSRGTFALLDDEAQGTRTASLDLVRLSAQDLADACHASNYRLRLDPRSVRAGLLIFAELGLLTLDPHDGSFVVTVNHEAQKVELDSSIRYLEACKELANFEEFASFALEADEHALLSRITHAIVPVKLPNQGLEALTTDDLQEEGR